MISQVRVGPDRLAGGAQDLGGVELPDPFRSEEEGRRVLLGGGRRALVAAELELLPYAAEGVVDHLVGAMPHSTIVCVRRRVRTRSRDQLSSRQFWISR